MGWVVTDEENWSRVKNIQCEHCHGPVGKSDRTFLGFSEHREVVEVNLSADMCGSCHQGSHHPTWTDWQQSKHAFAKNTTIPGGSFDFIKSDRECAACHTAEGFLQFLESDELTPDVDPPGEDGNDLTCGACHDPHSHENGAQLRLDKAEICSKCHNPEYNPDSPEPDGSELHHTTAYMFEGKGGWEFDGYTYQSSPHKFAATDKCVDCHVFMTEYVGEPEEIPAYTGHSFEPRPEACSSCHNDFDAFWTADSSYDYRGVQSEMDSLMHVLEEELMTASSEDSTSDTFFRAKFNLDFVHGEGSNGIHNTKYARALLQSAIAEFTPTAIEPINLVSGMPLTYTLNQNYPNPFNPTTDIKFSIKKSGNVTLKVYDLIGREIHTLVDKEMSAGVYSAHFDASRFASGVYIYRLVSNEFSAFKKMVLIK